MTAAEGALTAGLTTRQLRLLLIAIALFALSAILSFVFKLWHGYIDLQVYRNGARVWLDGGDLYGPMPKSGGIGLPFTYPRWPRWCSRRWPYCRWARPRLWCW